MTAKNIDTGVTGCCASHPNVPMLKENFHHENPFFSIEKPRVQTVKTYTHTKVAHDPRLRVTSPVRCVCVERAICYNSFSPHGMTLHIDQIANRHQFLIETYR